MEQCEVFISYKHTEEGGKETEDSKVADELYRVLQGKGVPVFMSGKSIFQLGISDYKKAIDTALDAARILVVIGTNEEYISSGWVEYEFETFCEDILSKRKPFGSILSYTRGISQDQLPRTLSRFQNCHIDEMSLERFSDFLCRSLKNTHSMQQTPPRSHDSVDKQKEKVSSGTVRSASKFVSSNYSSDYSNELRRLEIQAQNSVQTDRVALDWIYAQEPWPPDERLYVLDLGSAYGFVAADRFASNPRVEKILCVDCNARVLDRARILFAENQKMVFEVADVESESFVDDISSLMEKHDIPRLHIVFSALLLLHLRDPNHMLRKLRRLMKPGSYVIVRGSDDGSKLCYPHADLMEAIIKRCADLPEASDRYNGRKLFSQLSSSGFRNVRIFSTMTDLSEFDFDGRAALFAESFAYRSDAFRRRMEAMPNNVSIKNDYQWICDALEEFENVFYENNFWYCEYDYIAIGIR